MGIALLGAEARHCLGFSRPSGLPADMKTECFRHCYNQTHLNIAQENSHKNSEEIRRVSSSLDRLNDSLNVSIQILLCNEEVLGKMFLFRFILGGFSAVNFK